MTRVHVARTIEHPLKARGEFDLSPGFHLVDDKFLATPRAKDLMKCGVITVPETAEEIPPVRRAGRPAKGDK